MVGTAKGAGIKVLLLTPTPDLPVDMNNPHERLNQHVEQIRTLAKEFHVGLLGSYAAFQRYAEQGGKNRGCTFKRTTSSQPQGT